MSSPNDLFRIELATQDDAAELNAIYASDDGFSGDISVRFTREPDPYSSLLSDGGGVTIPLVREVSTGRAVGMGACVTRQAWVNGTPMTVGYLTGLKGLPEFRRKVPMIPRVYDFLRECTREVSCYYTTILSENTLARRMLEKRRRGMPEYRPVAEYTTYCYRVMGPAITARRLCKGSVEDLLGLGVPGQFNLASVGIPPGVTDADVRILRDRSGEELAWCVLHDRRAVKQYVITRYGGRYQRLAKLPVHWIGYPRLPKVGVPANYVSISALGARDDDPGLVWELLRQVGAGERRRDFTMVGLAGEHPFVEALAKFKTITYASQVYTVHFDDECLELDERPLGIDVALL